MEEVIKVLESLIAKLPGDALLASIAVAVELLCRLIKTEKPKSIFLVAAKVAETAGKLLTAVASVLAVLGEKGQNLKKDGL
jgi:hypothetical protein